MNLDALFTAPQPIPFHVLSAAGAIGLGAAQLGMRKGGNVHRLMGRLWLVLMALVAIGLTVYFARCGNIKRHRQSATVFYWLALTLTGFFTLLPGRIMFEVLLTDG